MRFSPAFLDELRARVSVSAYVGRKVRLKKEGREWRGLSPFSSEKTPSFFVNDQKGRWFDFSAGKNGNIFDFVMETEGLTFVEAVEKLAGEAGLALPALSREETARDAQRASVQDAMEEAAAFFEAQLRGRNGEAARAYLAGRGISEEIQRTFRIGLALRERFALRDHLAGKNVSRDMMIEGGLLVHGEGIEVPYDRFRERVMFPICDRSGRVIAFGGRALDPVPAGDASQQRHHVAKYLNSPETSLFHKSLVLFNHHRARRAAHGTGRVIVVEGYVDAIAMTAAGFADVVAPLGTALTPEQCALLWQMTPEPILCFDGDLAGRKAAGRAATTALPLIASGRTLRFALLPDGVDPDDLVRAQGAAGVEAVLGAALPLVELLWRRERDARPIETPEQRADLLERLAAAAAPIGDAALRRDYTNDLRGRAFDHFRSLRPVRPAGRAGSARPGASRVGPRPSIAPSDALARSALFGGRTGASPREAAILTLLMAAPGLIATFEEEIAALPLAGDLDRLRTCLLGLAGAEDISPDRAAEAVAVAGLGAAADRMRHLARAEPLAQAENPLDAEGSLRQALALHRRSVTLHRQLAAAQADFAEHPDDRNERCLIDLRTQLSDLGHIVGKEDVPVLPVRPGWG